MLVKVLPEDSETCTLEQVTFGIEKGFASCNCSEEEHGIVVKPMDFGNGKHNIFFDEEVS